MTSPPSSERAVLPPNPPAPALPEPPSGERAAGCRQRLDRGVHEADSDMFCRYLDGCIDRICDDLHAHPEASPPLCPRAASA